MMMNTRGSLGAFKRTPNGMCCEMTNENSRFDDIKPSAPGEFDICYNIIDKAFMSLRLGCEILNSSA